MSARAERNRRMAQDAAAVLATLADAPSSVLEADDTEHHIWAAYGHIASVRIAAAGHIPPVPYNQEVHA